MNGYPHREGTIASLGLLLMFTSVMTDYAASTMPSGFYQDWTSATDTTLTIFGVPILFFGLLKRIDIPPHSRAGIPTEKVFWDSAPESLLVTMFVYEGSHLAAVFVGQHALALQDLWGFILTPIIPLAWILIEVAIALLLSARREQRPRA
jgi:hypothetical protein